MQIGVAVAVLAVWSLAMTERPQRPDPFAGGRGVRQVLAASVTLAILTAGLLVEERTVHPSLFTTRRFDAMNASAGTAGAVAMFYSVETYNDTFSLEGPRGDLAPSAVRILASSGDVVASGPTKHLDPARNIGVCPSHRPPLGTTWWSSTVPGALAGDLRSSGRTSFRIEARVGDSWRPCHPARLRLSWRRKALRLVAQRARCGLAARSAFHVRGRYEPPVRRAGAVAAWCVAATRDTLGLAYVSDGL